MKATWLGAVAFAVILAGCASMFGYVDMGGDVQYKLSEDIAGPIHRYQVAIFISSSMTTGNDIVQLLRIDQAGKPPGLLLWWQYSGQRWRFMDGKVRIRTDKEIHTLQDSNPSRSVISGGTVMEAIYVEVSPDLFEEMAGSTSVRMQAWTDPVDVDMVKLRHFYDNYVAVTPTPPPAL